MTWLERAALAAVVWCGGCTCELLDVPDLGGEDDCFLGTACPDGTCILALLGPTDCCGFGGECPPCEGAWDAIECPDGTCVASAPGDPCCAFGGACDPGDDSSGSSSASSTEDPSSTTSGGTGSTGTGDGSSTSGGTGGTSGTSGTTIDATGGSSST